MLDIKQLPVQVENWRFDNVLVGQAYRTAHDAGTSECGCKGWMGARRGNQEHANTTAIAPFLKQH